MSEHIIVTTGIYDVIKDQLRRKKVTPEQEIRLANELKTAKQVLRRDLPKEVVTVNRRVVIKDHTADTEKEYILYLLRKQNHKRVNILYFQISL